MLSPKWAQGKKSSVGLELESMVGLCLQHCTQNAGCSAHAFSPELSVDRAL